MIARIVDGKRLYLGESIPPRIAERPSINRYHLWTQYHETDGFAPAVLVDVTGEEVLVEETWAKVDGNWVQGGVLVSREQHEEAEALKRASRLALSYGGDVALLAAFLAGFGYELPVPDVQDTIDDIKRRLEIGEIPVAAHGTVALLVELYRGLRDVMSDEDIVAVAQFKEP